MEESEFKPRKRKNVRLEPSSNDKGENYFRLIDLRDGLEDPNFQLYQRYLKDLGLSLRSIKRYSEVVSVHIDYLIERGVYGDSVQEGVTFETINDVVRDFIKLLEKGNKVDNPTLKRIADDLFITRISGSSFNSVQAALNHFYTLSERRAKTARQRMRRLMPDLPDSDDYEDVIIGITEERQFSENEKKQLRQVSMLGGVIRWHGKVQRPRSLPASKKKKSLKNRVDPFPLADLPRLLESANNYRDRLFWSILAFGGPRPSEALQLRVSDISIDKKEIFLPTAEECESSVPLLAEEKLRFKGREMRELWLLPDPFKSELFRSLKLYLLHEYVPTSEHPFLFQYLRAPRRGQPYWDVSETTLLEQFRGAINRAGIQPPEKKPDDDWDIYSLRHFYGHFLKNYMPNADGPDGMLLEEVQLCMGHADRSSTEVYATESERKMKAKFLAADALIHKTGVEFSSIAGFVADRIRSLADEVENESSVNNNEKGGAITHD